MSSHVEPPSYGEIMSDQDTISNTYAILSLHHSDTIRFLQFPESLYTGAAALLRASWPPGIQSERPYSQAYEYKLKGRPFGTLGDQESVGSRRLVRDLLAFLHRRGWVVVTPLNQSSHAGCKDTLIFRQQARQSGESQTPQNQLSMRTGSSSSEAGPSSPRVLPAAEVADPVIPPPVDWLVVTMSRNDKMRIIYDTPTVDDQLGDTKGSSSGSGKGGSSSSASVPRADDNHDELGVFVQAIRRAMTDIDCFQSGEWKYDCFEFKCKGTPWVTRLVQVRLLLLRLVETLDRFGWQSYVTMRQRTESDDPRKADTWYFVRPRSWAGARRTSGVDLPIRSSTGT